MLGGTSTFIKGITIDNFNDLYYIYVNSSKDLYINGYKSQFTDDALYSFSSGGLNLCPLKIGCDVSISNTYSNYYLYDLLYWSGIIDHNNIKNYVSVRWGCNLNYIPSDNYIAPVYTNFSDSLDYTKYSAKGVIYPPTLTSITMFTTGTTTGEDSNGNSYIELNGNTARDEEPIPLLINQTINPETSRNGGLIYYIEFILNSNTDNYAGCGVGFVNVQNQDYTNMNRSGSNAFKFDCYMKRCALSQYFGGANALSVYPTAANFGNAMSFNANTNYRIGLLLDYSLLQLKVYKNNVLVDTLINSSINNFCVFRYGDTNIRIMPAIYSYGYAGINVRWTYVNAINVMYKPSNSTYIS
jgi:hypothetical protein